MNKVGGKYMNSNVEMREFYRVNVGHRYLRRDGKIVDIKSSHRSVFVDNRIVFVDYNNEAYYENGSYWSDDKCSQFDLIKEI